MAADPGWNGSNLLLLVNTGTPAVPAYEVVGTQRDTTIEETTESIDVSSKDSRAERVLPGRYASTISLDKLFVPDQASYAALKAAMRDGEMILIAREELGIVIETANCVVESLSEAFPDQDAATVACSLKVDGWWDEVGS